MARQDRPTRLEDLYTDSYGVLRFMRVGRKRYHYFSLKALENHYSGISHLPFSLRVLLENLLRYEDGSSVTRSDIEAISNWAKKRKSGSGGDGVEISFRPARVLMQDFTGVPAIVDLAAMREAMVCLGGDPRRINPQIPVDLVVDHSVMVDMFGSSKAFNHNVRLEYARNGERYSFLKWGQDAFSNFRVVPPGAGICHQVNLEYLARTVWSKAHRIGGKVSTIIFPDTLVGTDSHTTMVNALSVLGWGVGGIEAEAAMLGQPVSMMVPDVIGFRLTGKLRRGVTSTDLVLTITEMLRRHGVVGKFVEFFGSGLSHMRIEDRATVSNMAPEYGATCGFFPIDKETLSYLRSTGRSKGHIAMVEKYARSQGLFRTHMTKDPVFTDELCLDLNKVVPSIAGPKKPEQRVSLSESVKTFNDHLTRSFNIKREEKTRYAVSGANYDLGHGDIVIAAITSCTNTSNPSVMLGAGLLARNAVRKGLRVKPFVKTSLAPGSQVVTDYLHAASLQEYLDTLGFNLVGYGCTTCIGNSGPIDSSIAATISQHNLVVCSVLSGNRNFEGRISPHIRANYLASPPLVVAYALAGTLHCDIMKDPLGYDKQGEAVFLPDIWPDAEEITDLRRKTLKNTLFRRRYGDIFDGDSSWRQLKTKKSDLYPWDSASSYIRHPSFFSDITDDGDMIGGIEGGRILALLGDGITTDHISPAGSIKRDSPAGRYLESEGVSYEDFNSYGSRRGNHEVMMRGTFANIRLRNHMTPDIEGGVSIHHPSGKVLSIYDAACAYGQTSTPLVIFAGREYGTGSSRDWAAKGTTLLGIKAVIAQSFERIHRSNLIGMGVLPLQFKSDMSWQKLELTGSEIISIRGIDLSLEPQSELPMEIEFESGASRSVSLLCRIDTVDEMHYYRNGGILHYVLRDLAA